MKPLPALLSWLFLSLIFLPVKLIAAPGQYAVVKNENTIVYADLNQQAPLGHLRKGKVIRVGTNPKFVPYALYPLIIQKKVAFIKGTDIFLIKDHNYQEASSYLDSPELLEVYQRNRLRKRKNISFGISLQQTGNKWKTISERVNRKSNDVFMFGVTGLYEHHPFLQESITVLGGLEFNLISDSQLSFASTSLLAGVNFEIFERQRFVLELGLLGNYAPLGELKIAENNINLSTWGYRLYLQGTGYEFENWGLRGTGGYAYTTVNEAKNINSVSLRRYSVFEGQVQNLNLDGLYLMFSVVYRLDKI